MYEHPLTAVHVATIRDVIGYKVLGPQMGKKLACGDSGECRATGEERLGWNDANHADVMPTGAGAMTDWREIVGIVKGRADDIITANAASTIQPVPA